jgi:hypothetical protein
VSFVGLSIAYLRCRRKKPEGLKQQVDRIEEEEKAK